DEHVEVPVPLEGARVQQLVLEVGAAPAAAGDDEVAVGELALRVLVEVLQVRVRRRAVEVEPVLLDVLAVVALAVREAEHPLLEDRVRAVPQGEREAEALALVGDAGDAVLAPAVGARARLVVGEVAPGVAVVAVVLAHRPPLALAEVRAPRLPRGPPGAGVVEAAVLGRVVARHGVGGHARDAARGLAPAQPCAPPDGPGGRTAVIAARTAARAGRRSAPARTAVKSVRVSRVSATGRTARPVTSPTSARSGRSVTAWSAATSARSIVSSFVSWRTSGPDAPSCLHTRRNRAGLPPPG